VLVGLVLLRELDQVLGQVRAEQNPFQILLQVCCEAKRLDPGDAHQIAPLLLEPADPRQNERLQLAGEATVPAPRAPRNPSPLAVLASQEDDDAVGVVEVDDVEQ
jgi:hypothetical protein